MLVIFHYFSIYLYIYIFLFSEIIESPVVRGANPDTIIYLRRLHQEYSLINNSGEKKRIWSAHARSVSLRCNVELRVLCILMRESHYDRTIPEDEVIVNLNIRIFKYCR